MRKIEVEINGTTYPCRQTMGALLRFKEQTGVDLHQAEQNATTACTYIYCCVVSSCAADRIPFDLSFMEFADALSPDDANAWALAMQEPDPAAAAGEKKTTPRRRS